MALEVKIKAKYMIKPAEKTWTGIMKLSEIDSLAGKVFISNMYFYNNDNKTTEQQHQQQQQNKKEKWDEASINHTLKESLAKVLVHFYPFTGRLTTTSRGQMDLHVDNDVTPGVPFLEAQADVDLLDLGKDLMEADVRGRLENLFCRMDDPNKPLQDLPLLMVQITHFRCGGVAVAVTLSHAIVDGNAAARFFSEWSRLSRGEALGIAPVHDRTLLRAGEPPRSIQEFFQGAEQPPLSETTMMNQGTDPPPPSLQTTVVLIRVSKSQIDNIKQTTYNVTNARPYTRFEVLAAHISRCISKAREMEGKKAINVVIPIDIRKRTKPPLPLAFSGNAIIHMTIVNDSEELNSKPLAYTCDKIRKTIDKVTNDLIWGYLDYQKCVEDLGAPKGTLTPEGILVNPDILCSSLMNLGFKNIDFGWGNESYIASETGKTEGVVFLMDGREEGSVIVSVCLKVSQVDNFKYHFFHHLQ